MVQEGINGLPGGCGAGFGLFLTSHCGGNLSVKSLLLLPLLKLYCDVLYYMYWHQLVHKEQISCALYSL